MAVLGSSDFALHEAEELSHTASRVTIFTDGKKPEFSRENQLPVNTMKIQAIEGDERVSGGRGSLCSAWYSRKLGDGPPDRRGAE